MISDCCSARAQNVVHVTGKGTLYFCGHHFVKHLPAIKKAGYRHEALDGDKLPQRQRLDH